mgnify:CR=1 FL=1
MYIACTILGIIFLYLDLIKKHTLKLTLASTFLFCAIIAYKFPENKLFLASGFICFPIIFYTLIQGVFKKEQLENKKEKLLDDFINKKAVVTKDIGKSFSIDGIGYIKYKNQIWQAKSIDDKEIKAGSKVEILSKENKIMNVKVLSNAKK